MRRFIALFICLLPFSAMAAIPEMTALLQEYNNTDDVVITFVNSDMLQAYGGEASENIDEMSVLVSENNTLSTTIFNTASEIMATTEATQMVKLNEDNQQVEIYTIKKDDVITDIVVMVHEGKRCVIVITSGTIPEDKINDYVNVSM
mgnify:FL=1